MTPLKKAPKPRSKLLKYENRAFKLGFKQIAGVDEAGRGPLAGPVVAAACIIKKNLKFEGINDSKLLTPQKRRSFFDTLKEHPQVSYGIGVVEAEIIDKINILEAAKLAMLKALEALENPPDYILIDAVPLFFQGTPTLSIIHGDALSQSIAAASILAKETRDDIMKQHHTTYPLYGFDEHKGYGTKQHRDALQMHGPTPLHRKSFLTGEIFNQNEFF